MPFFHRLKAIKSETYNLELDQSVTATKVKAARILIALPETCYQNTRVIRNESIVVDAFDRAISLSDSGFFINDLKFER